MKRMVVILGVIIGICIANNGEDLQFQGGFDKEFKGKMPIFNKSSDNNIKSPEQFNTKENFFDTPEQAIDNFSSEYFATPYINYNLGSTYEVEFISVQNVSKGDLPEKLPKGFDSQKNNTKFYKVKSFCLFAVYCKSFKRKRWEI